MRELSWVFEFNVRAKSELENTVDVRRVIANRFI